MSTRWRVAVVACAVVVSWASHAFAQAPATVREYQKAYKTYPFSDPSPVPVPVPGPLPA